MIKIPIPQVLAEAELTRADAKCLVAVLRSCRDAWVLIDVVKLLIDWLTPTDGARTLSPCGVALIARLTELSRLQARSPTSSHERP